jgi:hypothetical protein
MKLTHLLKENEEQRPLSNEVKKHFLEIVSTYNKYQEMMDRKSDLAQVAETLGGITEAAKTLLLGESDDWFDKVTIKRNMNELDKMGKEFDKVAKEANSLDQRMHGLYEDMGHILSRYYKMGEISEEQMKQRLGMKESNQSDNSDCGCDSVNEAGEDVNNAPIPADVKMRLQKALDVLDGKKLTYPQKLQVMGRVLDSMGIDKKELNKVSQKLRTKLESKINEKFEYFTLGMKKSITEAGEDVNNAPIPADVKMRLQKALDVLNAKKLTYPQKLQVLGRVLDSMGIDKKELNKVSQKLRTKLESIKEDGTLQGGEKDPCWKGYEMVGMKKGKDGQDVPNCVPKK